MSVYLIFFRHPNIVIASVWIQLKLQIVSGWVDLKVFCLQKINHYFLLRLFVFSTVFLFTGGSLLLFFPLR